MRHMSMMLIAGLPESVASFAERLRLQAKLWLDNGAHDEAAICQGVTTEDAPHVDDVDRRTIVEAQVLRWKVEVVDLGVLDVAHALVVADGEREEGDHHGAAICNVAVEQRIWVRDFHLLRLRVNVVDERIGCLGKVISGANVHVGASGRLGGEVSAGGQVVVTSLWAHDVRDKHVVALGNQVLLRQRQISVSARLIQCLTLHNGCLLVRGDRRANECRSRCLLLPVKGSGLDRGLASVAQLLLPAWVDLIGILLKRQERTLELLVGLGVLDDTIGQADVAKLTRFPSQPSGLALAARGGALLWAILVSEGAAASSEDNVGVVKVLKEGRQAKCIHATRDDWGCLRHALPLLVVVRAIGRIILKHVRDVTVSGVALHLSEAHGADVHTAGADDTRDLRVHEGGVTTLRLWAGHGTVASTVVVQELLWEVAAAACYRSAASDVAVNEQRRVLAERAEHGNDELATGNHLGWIVSSDVGGEELRHTSLLDARTHGLHDLRDALRHLAENLVALGLIVLDEIATLPESVASFAERLRLQAKLWLDDGAHDKTTVGQRVAAKDTPHVNDVDRWAVVQAQVFWWEVEVVDLCVLNVAHALVVADGEREKGDHHGPAISDVAIEQRIRVRNLHLL